MLIQLKIPLYQYQLLPCLMLNPVIYVCIVTAQASFRGICVLELCPLVVYHVLVIGTIGTVRSCNVGPR